MISFLTPVAAFLVPFSAGQNDEAPCLGVFNQDASLDSPLVHRTSADVPTCASMGRRLFQIPPQLA